MIWTHVLLKLVALITIMFGAPGVNYFEGEGYVIDNIKAEFNATVFVSIICLEETFVLVIIKFENVADLLGRSRLLCNQKHYWSKTDWITSRFQS